MSPVVYVSKSRLKPGVADSFAKWAAGLVSHVEQHEPQLLAFQLYLSADGEHAVNVQLHPDAASMTRHMQVVREYMRTAYADYVEATQETILCGEIEVPLVQAIKGATKPGASFVEAPRQAAGFVRAQR